MTPSRARNLCANRSVNRGRSERDEVRLVRLSRVSNLAAVCGQPGLAFAGLAGDSSFYLRGICISRSALRSAVPLATTTSSRSSWSNRNDRQIAKSNLTVRACNTLSPGFCFLSFYNLAIFFYFAPLFGFHCLYRTEQKRVASSNNN